MSKKSRARAKGQKCPEPVSQTHTGGFYSLPAELRQEIFYLVIREGQEVSLPAPRWWCPPSPAPPVRRLFGGTDVAALRIMRINRSSLQDCRPVIARLLREMEKDIRECEANEHETSKALQDFDSNFPEEAMDFVNWNEDLFWCRHKLFWANDDANFATQYAWFDRLKLRILQMSARVLGCW